MSKEKKITIIIIVCFIMIILPIVVFAEGVETYTISFNSMGGLSISETKASEGAVIKRPEDPSNPGHVLTGWFKEEECINEWNFKTDTVSKDVMLFAQWKDLYTVLASSTDASMGDVIGGGNYESGVSVTLCAKPKDGCRFLRWVESGSTAPVYSLIASVDVSITAEFAPIDTPSLSTISSGYNSITLNWTPLDYSAGYEIYRSEIQDGDYSLIYTAPSNDTLSFVDKGLETDNAFYYKVRAFCTCETAATYGGLCEPVSAIPKLTTPSASAAAGGYRSVKVSWNYAPGASGYEVYRSITQNGTYSKMFTFESSEASLYTDYNLTEDNVYYYKVRAFRTVDGKTYYSDYSGIQSARASLVAPLLKTISASDTSVRLTWDALSGVSGYEIYMSTSQNGIYNKIYTATSAPTVIYTNTGLKKGSIYYYKIMAYGKEGSKIVYGPYSPVVSAVPSTTLPERTFTILYQGDPKWGFSTEVRKNACLMSAYAITINNMGITATPKTVYKSNGNSTSINFINLATNFGVKTVCAVDAYSPCLSSYNGYGTYIKSPSINAAAAIKEALNKHPEGVICYFRRGDEAHAIVACKYDGDTIYYSDPGRTRKTLLTFNNTWVRCHHRMNYGNLAYIVALEKINEPLD